ncbi:hypothetical protein STRTUCAR8_09594, partial [Streptomyces turgidiscabies Car8]
TPFLRLLTKTLTLLWWLPTVERTPLPIAQRLLPSPGTDSAGR